MRIALHQVTVFEDAGLALFRVDHQVSPGRPDPPRRLPLAGRREIGPAAAQETCIQRQRDNRVRAHRKGVGQTQVTLPRQVFVKGNRVNTADALH